MRDFPLLKHHWYIACQSAQLRDKPLKREILGTPVVLFRSEGRAAALLDRCPHRNAPLSSGWVAGPNLVCPYHGWQFDGAGVCRAVPGLCGAPEQRARHAKALPVAEQQGLVWLYANGEEPPTHAPPRFDYLGQPGYTHFIGEANLVGSLPDALENFLDGTHTHFVHGGLIRTEGTRKTVRAIVRRGHDRVEAEYRDEGQQSGLISRLFGAGVDCSIGRFLLPSWAQLDYLAGGQVKLRITLCFTPESERVQHLFAVVVGQPPRMTGWMAAPTLKLLFWQALQQDSRILALQTENIERFGEEQFVYTELDVLRPHILRLLKNGPFPATDTFPEKEVLMQL